MADCPGVYRITRMRDGGLARVRLPGGQLTSMQLSAVADLADEIGNGLIDLTNRANLQLRALDEARSLEFATRLRDVGLLNTNPRRERLRNITASPLAGIDPSEVVDTREHVATLDRFIQQSALLDGLSPKFSFVFDGGGKASVMSVPHDVAFRGRTTAAGARYEVSLMGASLGLAVLPDVAARLALTLAEQVAQVPRAGGARMRDFLRLTATVDVVKSITSTFSDSTVRIEGCDFTNRQNDPAPSGTLGSVTQSQRHLMAFGLGVIMGRLTVTRAHLLAELANNYGDATLRLTPWQAVVLPNVRTGITSKLRHVASDAGFLVDPLQARVRVVACAGATACERTQLYTKADGAKLMQCLNRGKPHGKRIKIVHISGCERGCAHPGVADWLLLARSDGEGYEIFRDASPLEARIKQTEGRAPEVQSLADAVVIRDVDEQY